MWRKNKQGKCGFSLVELIIVIVIIGIIAAIAAPRVSRGAKGAGDSALKSDLAVLRNAIELYATEHGGTFPGPDEAKFRDQLLKYTDAAGTASDTKTATHVYGPYLRKDIPPLPVGANKGQTSVTVVTGAPTAAGTTGWVYSSDRGEIIANCADTEKDESDKAYNAY